MASAAQDSSSRTGSCLCGNVKYAITGQPFSSAVCHCYNCQKITGSAFATNAMFNAKVCDPRFFCELSSSVPRHEEGSRLLINFLSPGQQQVKVLSGEDSIKSYMDTAVDSGNVLRRSFCSNCGSNLFLQNTTHPKMTDVIIIMTGSIDGRKDGFAPRRELYSDRKYNCVSVQQGTCK